MAQWTVFPPDEQDGPKSGVPTHAVTFLHQEQTLQVRENQSLLQAAEAAAMLLPFSCRAGICTSCLAKVDGPIHQDRAHALTPKEQGLGWTLLCVAYPRGPLKVATAKVRFRYQRQWPQE